MTRRAPITGHDLMDATEVAAAFGVSRNTLNVAISKPDVYKALAGKLPEPLRKIGNNNVWLRSDVERAVREAAKS